jgi:hypothetical protein
MRGCGSAAATPRSVVVAKRREAETAAVTRADPLISVSLSGTDTNPDSNGGFEPRIRAEIRAGFEKTPHASRDLLARRYAKPSAPRGRFAVF